MKKITLFFVFCITAALFSCKQSSAPEDEVSEYIKNLTQQDTLDVRCLLKDYLTYAQDGKYGEAAAMLYKPDSIDEWNEPTLLENDELESVEKILEQCPVHSFTIDSLKFETPLDNKAFCTIVLKEGHDGLPPVTMHCSYRIMNYLGGWRLCLREDTNAE